jgi:hypothetical protein
MILEFLCGTLPWKGKNKETIGTLKVEMTNASLFAATCSNLVKIYNHLKTLGYSDKPDYNYICHVFDLILEDTLSDTSIVPEAKMEVYSMEKTEECISPITPEDDEMAPIPMTSPQIEKISPHYSIEVKETATLFEPVDYAQIGRSELYMASNGILIPRYPIYITSRPPSHQILKPKPSSRSNRYFLRSKK